MASHLIVYLHYNNKITQKRFANNFEIFSKEVFKITNKDEGSSDYLIQYFEKKWKNLDNNSFKRFSNLKKKEIKIIRRYKEPKVLGNLFWEHFLQIINKYKLSILKSLYDNIKLNKLKIKNDLIDNLAGKKMNVKLNFETKENSFLYEANINPFRLYQKLNDLTPEYRRIYLNNNEIK